MMFKFRKISLFTALVLVFTACGESGAKGDTTAPVITLKGASPMEITVGEAYTEKGAIANDDNDGPIKVSIDKGNLNTGKIGNYKVTYTAKDKSNNSRTLVRTVIVVDKDTTKPVITITTPATVKEGESFNATATAEDDKGGTVTVTIDTSKVNMSVTGTYNVTYTAIDKAGNKAVKIQAVSIVALTITELFEKSESGEINDVSYIVVGDSTRYYETRNDVLINERDSGKGYYNDLLSPKNITFINSAIEGQRVDYWFDNTVDPRKGGKSFTRNETLSQIRSHNPNHCIVEFSMGINDELRPTGEDIKTEINDSIDALQATGAKVLLVSPVPYYKYNPYKSYESEHDGYRNYSYELNDIYESLKDELKLPFVSGYDVLDGTYSNDPISATIGDRLHPNEDASKKLLDNIFEQIENDNL